MQGDKATCPLCTEISRTPEDLSIPPEPDDETTSPKQDLKDQRAENQKNLRRDADHLLQLAQELKDETDKTEHTNVLSLPLVRKAEQIEKLARQIKGLARAN